MDCTAEGEIKIESNKTCGQCPLNCKKCLTVTDCVICKDGFYYNEEEVENVCSNCAENCAKCSNINTFDSNLKFIK